MPSVSSVASSALVGAYGRFDAAASRTVQASTRGGGEALTEAVTGLQEAKTEARAALAVTRAADQMTGALLDLIA